MRSIFFGKIFFSLSKSLTKSIILSIFFLSGLFFVFELLEKMRSFLSRPDISYAFIIKLSLIALPQHILSLSPFIFFCSACFVMWKLSEKNEIIIWKNIGVSGVKASLMLMVIYLFLGSCFMMIINPIAAFSNQLSFQIYNKVIRKDEAPLTQTPTGFWIKEVVNDHYRIIRATKVNLSLKTFENITVSEFMNNHSISKMIAAKEATLDKGIWKLKGITYTYGTDKKTSLILPTHLTIHKIKITSKPPSHIPFWQIQSIIRTQKSNGLSYLAYELQHYKFFAEILNIIFLSIFAISIFWNKQRNQNYYFHTFKIVSIGFSFFFLCKILNAYAEAQTITLLTASFLPTLLLSSLAFAYILHKEEFTS